MQSVRQLVPHLGDHSRSGVAQSRQAREGCNLTGAASVQQDGGPSCLWVLTIAMAGLE